MDRFGCLNYGKSLDNELVELSTFFREILQKWTSLDFLEVERSLVSNTVKTGAHFPDADVKIVWKYS